MMDFKISDGIELQLRRIADALERAFPDTLPVVRSGKQKSADDLQVTSDESLAKIEDEERRAKGIVVDAEWEE